MMGGCAASGRPRRAERRGLRAGHDVTTAAEFWGIGRHTGAVTTAFSRFYSGRADANNDMAAEFNSTGMGGDDMRGCFQPVCLSNEYSRATIYHVTICHVALRLNRRDDT